MASMTAPRRKHNKSRGGCKQCKERRVKCGEEKPSCVRCIKRLVNCTYVQSPTDRDDITSDGLNSLHVSTPASSSTSAAAPDQSIVVDGRPTRLHEIFLMHWYSTEVYETLSSSPSYDLYLWQRAVPREASRFAFLTDGLMAISSLHLASLTPGPGPERSTHIRLALQYQNAALAGLKTAIGALSEVNINAIFGLSAIIMTVPLALFCLGSKDDDYGEDATGDLCCYDHPVTVVLFMCELLRGSVAVMRSNEEAINNSIYGQMCLVQELDPGTRYCEPARQAIEGLYSRAREVSRFVEAGRLAVYESGIDHLHNMYLHMAQRRHLGPVFAFPVMIDDKLVDLFRENDPMAQLIWLHYGVLLLELHPRWWGQGFGVQFIDTVLATLEEVDTEWAQWTLWPRLCADRARNENAIPEY